MKKVFLSLVVLLTTSAIMAGNIITYTASSKLPEEKDQYSSRSGLHVYAFNEAITDHSFSNGIGTITFAGEVTNIGYLAFYKCTSLTSITIPNSVTSIGQEAFSCCTSLTSLTIPNSVTRIENEAFYNCTSLTSVTIPNSVTSIGDMAFIGCSSLTSINIPNSVTSIGDGAFYYCSSLTSITIPNSVISIGDEAFFYCTSLTSITIPNSVTSIGNQAFYECSSITSITIPNSVTSIGWGAFYGCTSLPVENNLRYADWYLVDAVDKTLSTYIVKDGTIWIGDNAFSGCTSLTSITIPNSVTSIGIGAFSGCTSLTSITIPNSVTSIGIRAFAGVNNIVYSGTVTYTDDNRYWGAKCLNGYVEGWFVYTDATKTTLAGCSSVATGSITIPSSVTNIGDGAFYYCFSLTSVTIPSSVTSIGDMAFFGCSSLTSINIPNSVTSIGSYAFSNCTSLTSITIPNSVTSIGDEAFFYCYSLTSINIPNSVTSIGDGAFYYCSSLTSITCYATTPPTCGGYCFDDVNISIPLYVPAGSISAYQAADEWKKFTNILPTSKGQCGDNLTWQYTKGTLAISGIGAMYDYTKDSVPWYLFRDSITNVVIANGATSIGNYAFYSCGNKNFKTLVPPNSILTIGQYAFAECSWLKYITLGTDIEDIKGYAFANDQRLNYVTCYAVEPPLLQATSFNNWDAYLSVPCEAVNDYKVSTGWKLFTKENVRCIGAESTTTTTVTVTPDETTATITWPTNSDAESYTLVIKKDGATFCTLTFNAQGQLMNIAFAPGRGGSNDVTVAEAVAGGYKFTITSLSPGVKYTYNIDTKDAAGTTIKNYTGEFMTKPLTALEETSFPSGEDRGEVSKFIRDNQLLIHRDGKTYNAQGAEVR